MAKRILEKHIAQTGVTKLNLLQYPPKGSEHTHC